MRLRRRSVVLYGVLVFLLLAGAASLWSLKHRPGHDTYQRLQLPALSAAEAGSKLSLTWLGVTGVLLRDGDHALMIDPFFSRPPGLLEMLMNRRIAPNEPLIAQWLQRLGVSHLDAVLVSHSHFDHAMDAGVVARLTGAQLLGSESTMNIGRGSGVAAAQLQPIHPGEPLRFGAFEIVFIESRHATAITGGKPLGAIERPLTPPAGYMDYRLGATYSILIRHPAGTILHHGSPGYVPGMLKTYHADLVLLGVALIGDLDETLAEVVDAVGAKRLMPMHWDDFTRPLDQPLRTMPVAVSLARFFADMAERHPQITVQTLPVAQPVAPFP